MTKVLFINGSPERQGNTAGLAAALLKGTEAETLNLTDYRINVYGQTLPGDQFDEVLAMMKKADVLIIGSPVYWHNICGSVRNLLDRFYGPVSQGELSGKKLWFIYQGAAPEQWMMEAGEYTMKRFCHSVIWYTKNAKSMKRAFFVLSAFTIALPTIATLLNSVPDELIKNIQLWDMVAKTIVPLNIEPWIKLAVSVISAATAILTAFLNLFKFQHKWVQFRSTSEELQTELTVYLAQAGDYSEKTLTKPYVAKDKPVPEFSGEKLDELRENMFLINIEKIMAKEKSQWENLHKPSK